MDKKQKLLVLQGIPASGKTTWAREFLKGKTDWVRVNRDDLRRMRGDYWVKSQEDLINTLERNTIIFSLNAGYNVIVDATNLNPKSIDKWKQIANDNSVDIEFKKFDVSLKEAIERDNNRNGDGVGESVIKRFYYKYIDSNKEEIRYIKQDKSLPKAIICDIDGTLALRNGRSPFEFDKIDQDKVNEPILNILKQYEEYHIYIVSGRNAGDKEDRNKYIRKTWEWLEKNNIPFHELLMREHDDFRKDCIVKKEIYEKFIKDNSYVEFVLDDRNQTVDMWRDLGLPCLQVYYGYF